MKKFVSAISLFLALSLSATVVCAADAVIIGGSDNISTYTVEHYLESHYSMGNNLILTQTFDGAVGRPTKATPESFLGYTPIEDYKQGYITLDNQANVSINYTMDGFEVGDINCDGYIDLLDSTLLQRSVAKWDGYDYSKVCLYTSDVNADGDVGALDTLMLMNALAGNATELAERVAVSLNSHGTVTSYELIPGTDLKAADDIVSSDFKTYTFDGWYDSSFSKKYTVVPNEPTTLYAKYNNYTLFTFESGAYFDPLNLNRFSAVDNPSGDGKVLSGYVSNMNSNDNATAGTLRGFNPGIYEGVDSEGFKGVNGKTYTVTFKYRYRDTANCVSTFSVFGSNAEGLGAAGNKSGALTLSSTSNSNNNALPLTTEWSTFSATFNYTVDYPYFYFRFSGNSEDSNLLYIDDFVITESSQDTVLLNVHGNVTSSNLSVGESLPTLEAISDPLTETDFAFKGWYDSTLTNAYTTVSADVKEYYAVYEDYTAINFTQGGIYDPSNRYQKPISGASISSWRRSIDPTDSSNICINANLSNNINNTHFAVSIYDGISDGFKLESGVTYLVTFDYLVIASEDAPKTISGGTRGATKENIGIAGGKGTSLSSFGYNNTGKWEKATVSFTAVDDAADYPYFIILAQASTDMRYPNVNIYCDNIAIRSFDDGRTIKVASPVDNILFNENGNTKLSDSCYIGKVMPSVPSYYGAEFINWYDADMVTPYLTVPKGDTEFRAKYNADIINFTNGGYYDPHARRGTDHSHYYVEKDPTNDNNTVIKFDLTSGVNNHFALAASGYDNGGYKLTVGNTYTISFMYYAEGLNENGVGVSFRGASEEYIGTSGGKSQSYGSKTLLTNGVWTGVTTTFTYTDSSIDEPYLIFLAQDRNYANGADACNAIVYIDDVVIKETEPETTYASKTIKFNGRRPGDTYRYLLFFTGTRKLYIVIPDYNFPYIARMQLDNLVSVYSKLTGQTPEIVKESSWSDSSDYHCNIFVGDVTGDSSDTNTYKINSSSLSADDYAYNFGNCNVYINGGSTYALAMGISEFTNTLINSEASVDFQPGLSYSGKYSEKINSYSTKDYYRPTFMEDFTGSEINTDVWNIMDIGQYSSSSVTEGKTSVRSAAHTYIENDKLVINGAFDDKYYYGGMLRSHGKLDYKYGYLEVSCIIPNGGGLWTATWLTPATSDGLYYGEIDVNESYGDAKIAQFNIHLWPTPAGSILGAPKTSSGYESKASSAIFNDTFHTYGFLWTEDALIATIDGEIKGTYNFNDKDAKERYDALSDYMSLIVSMTVGNPAVDASKKLDESGAYWNSTNKYIVDYVHIYQIDGQDIRFTPPVAE